MRAEQKNNNPMASQGSCFNGATTASADSLSSYVVAGLCSAAVISGLAWPVTASAGPITGQGGIASEYLGKGLGKSDEDPAVFGSIRWESSGLYASGFASQAASSRGADAEIIGAVGYARDINAWSFDGQVMYRQMTGETNGIDSGYFEFQADVSLDVTDSLAGRIRVNYAPDTYGTGEVAWWTEAQGTLKLTANDKLSGAYALRRIENGADYNAWNIGLKHKFTSAVAADVRWYDTDSHALGSRYEGRLVGSLSYSF